MAAGLPPQQGLYDPQYEHDSCGVGFIVHFKGKQSHQIVRDGITALKKLNHRGACGCEANTGDGAGVLIQIPDDSSGRCARRGHRPARARPLRRGHALRSPKNARAKARARPCSSRSWRRRASVPRLAAGADGQPSLGDSALAVEPDMQQAFIARGERFTTPNQFERKLYVIRQRLREARSRSSRIWRNEYFYFPSLSCRTLVYKGMLTAEQLGNYFPDLQDPTLTSALCDGPLALQHQHLPELAAGAPVPLISPQRRDQHPARQPQLDARARGAARVRACSSRRRGEDAARSSDEAAVRHGRASTTPWSSSSTGFASPHAVLMLIPEAWQNHELMTPGEEGVLRVPRLPDGAVGRPRVHRFTNGKVDRRGARPQRPAP